MKINSAVFMRGVKGDDEMLDDGVPQVAFIGRSNAGKSSVINTLVNMKDLARSSSMPGRTRELNIFKINNAVYFVDLPGYGYARANAELFKQINDLVYWYLFDSAHDPKVVLIIDAEVGLTRNDLGMLEALEEKGREIVVVANKTDKIKKSQFHNQLKKLAEQFPGHKFIPFSSVSKIGVGELQSELLNNK